MFSIKRHSVLLGIAALIMGLFLWSYVSSYFALREETALASAPVSSNLEVRGKQLRAAIDQTYRKMSEAHELVGPTGHNDISFVIIQYIPLGTSFDDAERILKAAGFKIEPRPGPHPPRVVFNSEIDAMRFDEVASIDPYDTSLYVSKTVISVNLTPQAPMDYSKISKIYAGIYVM
jgi:hypothetical protein